MNNTYGYYAKLAYFLAACAYFLEYAGLISHHDVLVIMLALYCLLALSHSD